MQEKRDSHNKHTNVIMLLASEFESVHEAKIIIILKLSQITPILKSVI